jgi:hypothetical protein
LTTQRRQQPQVEGFLQGDGRANFVDRYNLQQPVIDVQANHAMLRVDSQQLPDFRQTADAVRNISSCSGDDFAIGGIVSKHAKPKLFRGQEEQVLLLTLRRKNLDRLDYLAYLRAEQLHGCYAAIDGHISNGLQSFSAQLVNLQASSFAAAKVSHLANSSPPNGREHTPRASSALP